MSIFDKLNNIEVKQSNKLDPATNKEISQYYVDYVVKCDKIYNMLTNHVKIEDLQNLNMLDVKKPYSNNSLDDIFRSFVFDMVTYLYETHVDFYNFVVVTINRVYGLDKKYIYKGDKHHNTKEYLTVLKGLENNFDTDFITPVYLSVDGVLTGLIGDISNVEDTGLKVKTDAFLSGIYYDNFAKKPRHKKNKNKIDISDYMRYSGFNCDEIGWDNKRYTALEDVLYLFGKPKYKQLVKLCNRTKIDYDKIYDVNICNIKFYKNGKISIIFETVAECEEFWNMFKMNTLRTE